MAKDHSAQDKNSEEAAEKEAETEVTDDFVTREHQLGDLRYRSTAGRLVLRKEQSKDGKSEGFKAKAEIFVTSYVVDSEQNRPVVFAFNGGPGSSSVWLHMGLLGPRIVDSGDVDSLTPPPYGLLDNERTILKHADLVMIDPVSTGYSRVVKGGKDDEFHAFVEDRDLVAEVIRLWTTRNNRWLSAKYLVGESYGTLRAVAVAARLFDAYGMAVNGLGLISTVLNMSTLTSLRARTPLMPACAHLCRDCALPRPSPRPGAGRGGCRGGGVCC